MQAWKPAAQALEVILSKVVHCNTFREVLSIEWKKFRLLPICVGPPPLRHLFPDGTLTYFFAFGIEPYMYETEFSLGSNKKGV